MFISIIGPILPGLFAKLHYRPFLTNDPQRMRSLTLVRSDGATFKISSVIQYLGTLGSTVQSEVVRRHMPQALEAFKKGNTLPFGPLTVGFQGIGNGKGTLPWNMVQPIILQRGYVIVKRIGQRSNFAKVRVTVVPNLPVFLGIVKYAQSPRQQ